MDNCTYKWSILRDSHSITDAAQAITVISRWDIFVQRVGLEQFF